MYLFGLPSGMIVDLKGPRIGALCGSILLGAGYFGLWRGVDSLWSKQHRWLIIVSIYRWTSPDASGRLVYSYGLDGSRRLHCISGCSENCCHQFSNASRICYVLSSGGIWSKRILIFWSRRFDIQWYRRVSTSRHHWFFYAYFHTLFLHANNSDARGLYTSTYTSFWFPAI